MTRAIRQAKAAASSKLPPLTERQIQRLIVEWLQAQGYVVMHVPNGGSRNAIEGYHLKRDGVLAGAPDLIVAIPHGRVLWLEVKSAKGSLQDSQKDVHHRLSVCGHKVHVVRSLDEVQDIIKRIREAV